MAYKLAKIIVASDGEQVLFYKGNGDDGPTLVQVSHEDGVLGEMALGFDSEEDRDKAFDMADVEHADNVRKIMKNAAGGSNG